MTVRVRISQKNTKPAGAELPAAGATSARRRLLAFELLASLVGALLQVVLQLLLLLLEHFRIGGRSVIGLAEIGERQDQADRLAPAVVVLHHQLLALLQFSDQAC